MSGEVVVGFPAPAMKIMLVAVEPSGDQIGAALIRELKKLAPKASFYGCGGPAMVDEGLHSLFPIEAFAVMGLTDALRALPTGLKRADELTQVVVGEGVGAVVFIDAWGFSRLCATRIRKRAPRTRLFKLAAPQIWASRPGRIDFVHRYFDGVLCLLPFEPALFEKAGVRAEFIGNPNFQAAWRSKGDGARFRKWHDLDDSPLLAVLPGSRRAEVKHLLDPFEGAVRLLADRIPDLRIAAIVPPHVKELAGERISKWSGQPVFAHPDEKYDAFAAADAALAKSGTVTTELAISQTPMAVAYKVDFVSGLWLRGIATTPFVTVLNVMAGREIIPEFLQEDCRPALLAGALLPLLTDKQARLEQLEEFPALLAGLGVDAAPAGQRAAEKIIEWLGSRAPGA